MFMLRFDMRAPLDGPAATADLYQAAIEMAEWGESRGCVSALVSEHHTSSDGYIPSPLILASAIASRTRKVPINCGAVLLNFYDPIKLAEDMVILDIVSQGRVSFTIGLGYRAEEYAMFGVEMRRRGRILDGKLEALLRAVRGEAFEYEGRPVQVTPPAFTPGGPSISLGGQSEAAAKRAGRNGIDFLAGGGGDGLAEVYRAAALEAGHEPGLAMIPGKSGPMTLYVAKDLDRAWKEIGPFMLHDAKMYAEWMGNDTRAVSHSPAQTVDELRSENGPYRIVTPEEAVAMIRAGAPLPYQPLSGGCPPELAWESLKLYEAEVLPALG